VGDQCGAGGGGLEAYQQGSGGVEAVDQAGGPCPDTADSALHIEREMSDVDG
jgi:hypothetical protein